MNISKLISTVQKTVSDNSPVILTALGVSGTLATAYLTAKATFRASKIINDAQFVENVKEQGHPLDTVDKVKLVWKEYIPPTVTGVTAVTCIVCANVIGTRRAAALAAAYTLSERAFTEYSEKVVKRIGDEEEKEIRDEIAADRVMTNPPNPLIAGTGDVLCHDAYSGRYFMSSKTEIERAQNSVNYNLLRSDWVTLTDFYDKIGLEPTSVSDELGWNSEQQMELLWSPVEAPDGRPCLSFDFATVPKVHPWQFDR